MRTAGILMPITSLPSPYGVGTLGQCARDFIQFLHRAGQTYWQILPICPTGYGDSPYQSFSSYAGNPYMIDFDDLKKEGLLQEEEYASISWGDNPARVDYSLLYSHKFSILRIACSRISGVLSERFQTFCKEQNVWLKITTTVNPGRSGRKLSRKEKKILWKPSARNLPMKSCSGKRFSFCFSINGTN